MRASHRLILMALALTSGSQTAWTALKPMNFTIVMHIEGYRPSERTDETRFRNHKNSMNSFIVPFEDRGGALSAELNSDFVAAIHNFEGTSSSNTAMDLIDRGHSVNVHADLAGTVGEETQISFLRKLYAQKTDLEALTGAPVLGASGVCSDLDWVRAVKSAGFAYATSLVDYCLKALDPVYLSHDYGHTLDCTTASECHTAFPFTDPPNTRPWRTRRGADWIFHYSRGPRLLTVFPPYNLGAFIECLREGETGETCTEEPADIEIFKTRIKEALRTRRDGEQHYLYIVVSIGMNYSTAFVESLAEAVDEFVTDGDLVWKNMDEFHRAYMAGLSSGH